MSTRSLIRGCSWLLGSLVLALPINVWGQSGCSTCPDAVAPVDRSDALMGAGDAERTAAGMWREARLAWREKDWERILPATDALIHAFPGTAWEARARSLKGLFLKFNDRWDEAMEEFDRVLALDAPQRLRHDVQTSRACVLMTRGRYDDAERILEEVRSETRDKDQIRYVISWIKEVRRRREHQQGAGLNSCGAKALAFVLKQSDRKVSEEMLLAALAPFGKDVQLSLETLQKAASAVGYGGIGVKLRLDQLSQVRLPALMLVKPGHYVVVTEARDGKIGLYDPERGRLEYTPEVLGRKWTGWGLLFGEVPALKDIALASPEEMARLVGSACACCANGGIGPDRPNGPYYDPDGPGGGPDDPGGGPDDPDDPGDDSGCPGMPHYKYDLASMNLIVEDTDLSYRPLKGPSVTFKRTFNDDASSDGDFGPQWTHSYNIFVTEFPGQVQVTRGSGRIDIYLDLGAGNYDPPQGITDTLKKNADGTFSLELWAKKVRYDFDLDGTLARIVDRNDNAVTLSYTDNFPMSLGSDGIEPGLLNKPHGVVVDHEGNRYVTDYDNNRIQKFRPDGTVALVIGSLGAGDGQFDHPSDIALDPSGYLYIADRNNHRICKLTPDGQWVKSWGGAGSELGQFSYPEGIAVGGDAVSGWFVFVADTVANSRIQKFDL